MGINPCSRMMNSPLAWQLPSFSSLSPLILVRTHGASWNFIMLLVPNLETTRAYINMDHPLH